MARKARPHVSEALRRLRAGVIACAVVIGVCLVAQMLVWAFVHYTDVRWMAVEESPATSREVVVATPEDAQRPRGASLSGKSSAAANAIASTLAADGAASGGQTQPDGPVDPNKVHSAQDTRLELVADTAAVAGALGALILTLLLMQAVVIAGGASVPGVERAVSAMTWGLVVCLLCLPLQSIAPAFPFAGVFSSYEAMTSASETISSGVEGAPSAFSFFASFLLFPVTALVALMIIVLRFLSGIEQGAIVTSVSELDEKLEREIASIRVGSSSTPRTIGALNRALGETELDDDDGDDDIAASLQRPARKRSSEPDRPLNKPAPGEPLRRPI